MSRISQILATEFFIKVAAIAHAAVPMISTMGDFLKRVFSGVILMLMLSQSANAQLLQGDLGSATQVNFYERVWKNLSASASPYSHNHIFYFDSTSTSQIQVYWFPQGSEQQISFFSSSNLTTPIQSLPSAAGRYDVTVPAGRNYVQIQSPSYVTYGNDVYQFILSGLSILSATNMAFDSQASGGESAPLEVQIQNNGNAPIVSPIFVVSGDFARKGGSCGQTIPADSQCSVALVFKPTTTGGRTGQLKIYTDPTNNTYKTVSLSGTGTAPIQYVPIISLSTTQINFGTQVVGTAGTPVSVTISNIGNADITDLSLSLASEYVYNNGTSGCSNLLRAGESCVVQVKFAPTAIGTRLGSLQVISSAPGSPQSIQFTGTGLVPADTTAPVLSTPSVSSISSTSATISWTTDESGDTWVGYGTTTGLGQGWTSASGVSHTVMLNGLMPSTTYYYRACTQDAVGNKGCAPSASTTLSFTTAAAAAPTLTSLSVSCPSTINASASGSCTVTASYSNASSKSVSASWSSSNSTALPVNSSGSLAAGTPSADTSVTITANYSEGGVSKAATASVTVKAAAPTLTSLSASCPSAINSGATGACTATAGYSNGTSKSVSPAWATYNSTILTVSSGGALTAGNVTSSTSATIAASYTEGGITKTATQAITVNPSNRAPVASNGSLGVAGSTAASGTLSASDPDGNALTYSIVAQPSKGSVTLNNATTGAYTYTPNSGASGTDSFTFKASDGTANSNIATVTLTIAVQALNPPLLKINNVTTPGTVTMHQGDTCSITFDPVPGAVNYTFYAGNSSNVYIPAYTQILTDTNIPCSTLGAFDVYFMVKTNGAGGVQSAASAEWHVVNIMNKVVPEFSITPNDSGSQGTTTLIQPAEFTMQVKPVQNATSYKLYWGNQPRAATGGIYPAGNVQAFPAAGQKFTGFSASEYYFAVKAVLPSGESEFSNEWHLVVTPLANRVPVASNGSLNITGSASAIGNLSASDPDGNALTYSIVVQPTKGSVSLNPATGAYTYTPTAGASGSDSFTFKASDGKADSNIGTVTLSLALAPCSFTLASSSYTISAGGGNQNVSVSASTSSCSWSADSTSNWITIASGAGSQGSGTVTLSIVANTGTAARTATITIAGQTVTITQAGTACTLQLSGSAASFSVSGGSSATSAINGSFGVSASSSECTWAATADVSWITIANASGKGNATIAFVVQPNTQGASRTGSISVNGQKYTITQEGVQPCAYTLSANSKTFPATGGLGSVDVASKPATCSWEVASGATWVSLVSQAQGTANGTISFNVAANTATASRTTTLTVSGNTFTVTQDGAPVRSLVITPGSLDFGDQPVQTTSAEKLVAITNNGSANVDLSGKILPRLDNFLVPGQDCAVLRTNDKCTLRLAFAPVTGGKKAESLEFTDSQGFHYAIALNGNGKTASTPKVNIDTRVSGSADAQTLLAVVNTNSTDLNKTGSLYLVALAPGLGRFYKSENGQWLRFEDLDITPYQSNVQLGVNAIDIVSGLDLRGLAGTQVYAGYGVGSSPQEATANLIKDGTYSLIYTVPNVNAVVPPTATAPPTTSVAPPDTATPSCMAPQVLQNNQCVTPASANNLAPYISSVQVKSTPQCLTGCSGYTYQGGADVNVTFTAIDPEGGLVLTKFTVYAGAGKFYVDGLTDSIQSASGSAVTSDSLNTGSGNGGYGAYVGLMYACLVPTDGQGNQGAEKCASFEIPSAGSGVTTPTPTTSCNPAVSKC